MDQEHTKERDSPKRVDIRTVSPKVFVASSLYLAPAPAPPPLDLFERAARLDDYWEHLEEHGVDLEQRFPLADALELLDLDPTDLPESILSEIKRQRVARDMMQGTRTVIFPGGQVTLEANGHSVLVTETINNNAGATEFDVDDMIKTAYGQKNEVVQYRKVKQLAPPPDPIASGCKEDTDRFTELKSEFDIAVKYTFASGPTGKLELDSAYARMREEYEKLSRAAQERAGALPALPTVEHTGDGSMLNAMAQVASHAHALTKK